MLTSLPPITPRETQIHWSSAGAHATSTHPSSNGLHSQQSRRTVHARNPTLAALDAEEDAIVARKANVRRLGATWLRPPGIGKTYQAMIDEAAERAEQEALAMRDALLEEQRRTATDESRRVQLEHGLYGDSADVLAMDRDLDEEVPEAAGEDDMDSENDVQALGENGTRDLDDDVPEAGSYEHTDTEAEDSSEAEAGTAEQMAEEHVTPGTRGMFNTSTGEDPQRPMVVQNMTMIVPAPASNRGISNLRGDLHSPVLGSSPTVARQPRRARQAAAPSGLGGPARRSNNNENQRSGD